jgi:predicted dienelactone hydrolase
MVILPLLAAVLLVVPGLGADIAQTVPLRSAVQKRRHCGRFHTTLADIERGRTVHLLVIFPVQAEAQSPLIVLTHRLLLTGEDYRSYALHMATHGLVVALPTLPMSLFSMHHGELARDVAFVVEACLQASLYPGHPLEGRIDAERIGVAGHSLGGKLSLMAALIDPRISAAVLLDPVD